MRTSIATVCLSGSLVGKLHACAEAGFDGVEIFEPDLVAAPESPEEIRALAERLGLSLDLHQPFRDAEGVEEEEFARVLHRAEAKLALMERLGIGTLLVCSNVATATIDDDDVSAGQLRRLGDLAARRGIRIAFEALAWGRYVDDYRRAWRIVELADHPAVGTCLDSFHILSRGHDPADIAKIPGEKIFFLQLADAPALTMDLLSWSRHHRLFPGEGSFDLTGFLRHVLAAGYAGPLSLEVFNDTFRQTDPARTARQALRSLRWLADGVDAEQPPLPPAGPPTGYDFVEVRAEDVEPVEVLLEQLGFGFGGRHRSKPGVRLWTRGDARVVCNAQPGAGEARLAAVGYQVADPGVSADRAARLLAPRVHRTTYAGEEELRGVAAPDGTEVFLGRSAGWVGEFEGGRPAGAGGVTGIDHVNLVQPWQHYDEAVLFHTSVLSLETQSATEVAGPAGLVRSQVMRSPDGRVRLPLNLLPVGHPGLPQHVAFACDDLLALAADAVASRAATAPCAGQLLRRPRRPLRPRPGADRPAAGARRPLRPRRARRVPPPLHPDRGWAVPRAGRAPRRLRRLRRPQCSRPAGRAVGVRWGKFR